MRGINWIAIAVPARANTMRPGRGAIAIAATYSTNAEMSETTHASRHPPGGETGECSVPVACSAAQVATAIAAAIPRPSVRVASFLTNRDGDRCADHVHVTEPRIVEPVGGDPNTVGPRAWRSLVDECRPA